MTKNKINEIMFKRGFHLEKELKSEIPHNTMCIYIKENDVDRYNEYVILTEVCLDGTWHMFYQQPKMVGFMDSGNLENIENDIVFKKLYDMFNKQVELLRDGLT